MSCERARKYLEGLRGALKSLNFSDDVEKVVDLARRYVDDTEYYVNKGDCETALVTASYAEGLLDALRLIGKANFQWKREERPKVLVGGTFDLLHPGHVELLKEASKYGDVIAVVARDENVRKIRGRDPVLPQEQRAYMLSSIKYVKEAMVGEEDPLESILKVKPDIVFLGPDQFWKEEELKRRLRERGLEVEVIRMKEKKCIPRGICSSRKIVERVLELFCGKKSRE
ncbi:cytidyltransferase [Ignicoccus islandicus DSM 13165]|uniref:Cytidyltransferase n=1 Tax=Ignicoccus islandicus DSM 13165 TaxID=940295 RepID=A0A0U3FNH4_9CREN|nr:DUF357 domain-containing protein [Ignicoccus islandicus]ALU11887.1 cytidyltransferase [Ignicoccus islandicus DSM 13165]